MQTFNIAKLLSGMDQDSESQEEAFALVTLGIIELLASGGLNAVDATRVYFNAENCLYVRKNLSNKAADAIMSHGVQLQDLFEALPADDAQQEFQRELASIRSLCLQLAERHSLVS